MHIGLFTRYDRRGASSRLRTLQYVPYLRKMGIEVSQHPLLDEEYLRSLYEGAAKRISVAMQRFGKRAAQLRRARSYDLLWVEKELFPWVPEWLERRLIPDQIPLVLDYDDAVFHRYDAHPSVLVRQVLGGKIAALMRTASAVVVGNRYLAEYAARAGAPCVEIVSTCVDLERYKSSSRGDRPFTIGWIGTPYTSKYLVALSEVFRRLALGGNTKFLFIGCQPGLPLGVPYEARTWSEESEVASLRELDVGIMPLPDSPFERGKCGYKLIQYMACGVPAVASPVGVNCDIISDDVNGFLASNDADWFRALDQLRSNPCKARELGANGRKLVEERFSVQRAAERLAEIFQRIDSSMRQS